MTSVPWREYSHTPCTAPVPIPPCALSASIFTAPNVERHRPSACCASICCGCGGLCPAAAGSLALLALLLLEVAEPTAARHEAATSATRATFPSFIGDDYSLRVPSNRRSCCL